jgi:hypothetical protein
VRAPTRTGRTAARTAVALLLLAGGTTTAGCADGDGTPVDLTPPPGQEQRDQAAPADPLAGMALPPATSATGTPEQTTTPEATPGGLPSSSVGGVVEGFPVDLLPPYPGAEVLLTSATGSAGAPGRLDVGLAGRTGDPAAAVVEHYRRALTAAGFAETPATGSPGGQAVATSVFTRSSGTEVLTVAVADTGGARQFSIGGALAPPAP